MNPNLAPHRSPSLLRTIMLLASLVSSLMIRAQTPAPFPGIISVPDPATQDPDPDIELSASELAIASNGKAYLLVWREESWSGSGATLVSRGSRGALVSQKGERLTSSPIAISTGSAEQYQSNFRVASDGRDFLVIWHERQFGTSQLPYARWDIYGARLDSSGRLLDQEPIPIAVASAGQRKYPTVTGGAGGYLVVYRDRPGESGEWDILGTRVSKEGRVLDITPIPIATTEFSETAAQVAWNGERFLAAWTTILDDGREIRGALLNPDSSMVRSPDFVIAEGGAQITAQSAVSRGQGFLVTYTFTALPFGAGGQWDAHAVRLDQNGNTLDQAPIILDNRPGNQALIQVSPRGQDHIVTWRSEGGLDGLLATRLTSDGTLLDTPPVPITYVPGTLARHAIASIGDSSLAVWAHTHFDVFNEIYVHRIEAALIGTPPPMLTGLEPMPTGETVLELSAWPGSNYVVEHSDDLNAWSTLEDLYNFPGEGQIVDDTGGDTDRRFYRVREMNP